jgi:hypothetical protein
MTRPTMTGASAGGTLELHMFMRPDRPPDRPDHRGDGTGAAGLAGRRSVSLVALFGSVPFRQLAGPCGVFFLWPPKSPAQAGPTPGRPA